MAEAQPTGPLGHEALHFLRSQTIQSLPYPEQKFTDQTIIVTGSNVGLGLEAARHFIRLNAANVILAVRTVAKGEAAKQSIIKSEKCDETSIQVWELDLASTESTTKFAERASSLPRLDVVVANAGVYHTEFKLAEQDEETIKVNVINTLLLGILLLPKLRQCSVDHKKENVLAFVGSFVHYYTQFPEHKAASILDELAKKETARMPDRYNVSKMMELLLVRELAAKMTASDKPGNVVTSVLNPGYVHTSITRNHASLAFRGFMVGMKLAFSRTAEQGSRTLVFAAYGGAETHGKYLADCVVGKVSPFVVSEEGQKAQKKLWQELSARLDEVKPGTMAQI